MHANEFNQINTLISVKEDTFLTKQQINQLFEAETDSDILVILQDTNYHFTKEDLQNPDLIENRLMQSLASEYRFAYQESPYKSVVDILGAYYIFHNLKLLMKIRATEEDLESLVIPIGPYSMNQLQHIVQTQEMDGVFPSLLEGVRDTWNDYMGYRTTEAIDVGMDMAYFDYLREIANELEYDKITSIVDTLIDFYNIITGYRGVEQKKPHSFMVEMMSDKGTITIDEFIKIIKENQVYEWFNSINQLPFSQTFDPLIEKMKNGEISTIELEKLETDYLHNLFMDTRLTEVGPMPTLRYLFGKETEVKNLRLILTGRVNHLPKEQIKERVRPVYGETV